MQSQYTVTPKNKFCFVVSPWLMIHSTYSPFTLLSRSAAKVTPENLGRLKWATCIHLLLLSTEDEDHYHHSVYTGQTLPQVLDQVLRDITTSAAPSGKQGSITNWRMNPAWSTKKRFLLLWSSKSQAMPIATAMHFHTQLYPAKNRQNVY